MSDSRLEKFIYAICSMDVSDLPVPLSRIEKLWNCLITGETPDFEPLSRNEKYLMAMLDRYDISNLPAPMSRGEKLLYKIAVGETDLSDVPGYLSRYEELLKYLIENGEISEDDFEYVLYTLNQSMYTLYTTAEKPVKSAILKGNTLVNLHKLENYSSFGVLLDEGWKQHFGNNDSHATWRMYDISMLKPNTDYGVFCWVSENTLSETYWECHAYHSSDTVFNAISGLRFNAGETGMRFGKLTTISDFTGKTCGLRHLIIKNTPSTEYVKFRCVLMEYQDGMENWDIPYFTGMQSVKMPVLTTSNEDGTKTNILTVNGDVELRGIGDVRDELDCLTGEVTEHIIEDIIDGRTISYGSNAYMNELSTAVLTSSISNASFTGKLICNNLKVYARENDIWINKSIHSGISFVSDMWGVCIKLPHTLTGVTTEDQDDVVKQKFKSYLQSNPITIQYEAITPIIKTVDLTVVDQDNQPTELGTFENVTHVLLEAENLIPEVEMEVATNLLEDTVFNLTNAFNTLYPTAAKPVKSAILKGQTLVNVVRGCWFVSETNYFGIELNQYQIGQSYMLILIDAPSNITQIYVGNGNGSIKWSDYTSEFTRNKNYVMLKVTCPSKYDGSSVLPHLRYLNDERPSSINNIKCMLIEYQDGMENWDISYFTGMQSVKMPVLISTGKNLFDKSKLIGGEFTTFNGKNVYKYHDDGVNFNYNGKFENNTQYTLSMKVYRDDTFINKTTDILIYYSDGTTSSMATSHGHPLVFTSVAGKTVEKITGSFNHSENVYIDLDTVQIEKGTKSTTYEPYKSNILTVNEEVELRGIGDVQDELDLITGELTQRFGEIVFDGSENWIGSTVGSSGTFMRFYTIVQDAYLNEQGRDILCDRFTSISHNNWNTDIEGIHSKHTEIHINIPTSKLESNNVPGFKKWLSSNPVTVCYLLATESVKTVDLTVVDQDNQPTQLGTFENLTHVLLDSEGLIPNASLTVRTKIPTASSTNLLMDTVSTEQEQLNMTVNEQSENVDATMIAVTEIYEETL